MNEVASKIQLGRRVRYTGDMANASGEGVIVAIRGEVGTSVHRKMGPFTVIERNGCSFDVAGFDGRQWLGISEHSVELDGAPRGSHRFELLDKMHGPAIADVAIQAVAAKAAADALAKAEAPHRQLAADAARVMPDQVPLFYWNGIKDAKGAPLQKAYYSSGYQRSPEGTIQITAKHYERFSDLVRACFPVRNDSDVMTDYFCQDGIEVTPAHPLYPQVKAAKEAQDARQAKRAAR